MEDRAVVAAFSESPILQETLAVLLERECQLQFLSPQATPPVAALAPDLALLATASPAPLLRELTRQCPTLPIVSVEIAPGTSLAGSPPPYADVTSVPLEPHAIRAAVIRHATRAPDPELHAAVRSITDALCADLAPSLSALRTCACDLALGGPAASPTVLAGIVRTHGGVVATLLDALRRFQTRPRASRSSAEFAPALCREIARQEAAAGEALLQGVTIESSTPLPPGPVHLAPLLGDFLRDYLSRRATAAAVRAEAGMDGVRLSYSLRSARPGPSGLLSLCLARLALACAGWTLVMSSSRHEEVISLSPTAAALEGAA